MKKAKPIKTNKNILIEGVNVNADHPDVKAIKTVADVKKLGYFSHLGEGETDAANKLLEALKEKPAEKPAETAK